MKNMKINTYGTYDYDAKFAKNLSDSFTKYNSDKASWHAYHEIYSHILADKEINSFLEIGLFLSNDIPDTDLHAWAEVFPNALIFGADRKEHLLFSTDRIKTFYVDQGDLNSFISLKENLPNKIDVILDDASHLADKTITTFEQLFKIVSEDGVYLIEDILDRDRPDLSWNKHQKIDDLVAYFENTSYKYEIFSSSAINESVDSIVIAIFK